MEKEQTEVPYELIGKYASGNISEEELAKLNSWRGQSEDCEEEFRQTFAIWVNSFEDSDAFKDVDGSFQKVNAQLGSVGKKKSPWFYLPIAASIVLVMTLGYLFLIDRQEVRLATAEGEVRKIELPDGSIVWLNESSELVYPSGFVSQRNLNLSGEAYFEVAKDPNHPFTIVAEGSKTVVLGTAFNLKVHQNGNVSLTVQEGRVQFSDREETFTEIVTSGEMAAYEGNAIAVTKTNHTHNLYWRTKRLEFSGEMLHEVVSVIEANFGVSIELDKSIAEETVTVVFEEKGLQEILDILAQTLDLHVEKQQDTILIKPL